MPFAQMASKDQNLLKFGVNSNDFLEMLPEAFKSEIPWSFRTKNFQAFELGLDNLNESPKYISGKFVRFCFWLFIFSQFQN